MKAIRITMDSARLAPLVGLPVALRDREVDVIIQPKLEETKKRPSDSKRKSMMGVLHQYANPALRELEEGAWERAAVEKYLETMRDDRS